MYKYGSVIYNYIELFGFYVCMYSVIVIYLIVGSMCLFFVLQSVPFFSTGAVLSCQRTHRNHGPQSAPFTLPVVSIIQTMFQ